jgi:CRISPR/Cas system CSM-associated protein Csm5 (group 7 of RAMP superfamily)
MMVSLIGSKPLFSYFYPKSQNVMMNQKNKDVPQNLKMRDSLSHRINIHKSQFHSKKKMTRKDHFLISPLKALPTESPAIIDIIIITPEPI